MADTDVMESEQDTELCVGHFLNYHDVEFVQFAYGQILLRDPDDDGLGHFLGLVRAGESRKEIVYRILNSEEGKRVGVKVSGLRGHRLARKLASVPVLGNLMITFDILINIRQFTRDLRALHNHLYRLSKKVL